MSVEVLSLIGASAAWFTPLAAVRVYENAFALSYTGVNTACLSMTLLFLPLLALTYLVLPYPKEIGIVCSICSLLGMVAIVLSQYFVSPLQQEAQLLFWAAMAVIGLNFADNLLKALVAASAQAATKISESATVSANRTSSLAWLGLPAGMLIALTTTELLYDVKDTYFTNDSSALRSCCILNGILLAVEAVSGPGSLIFGSSPWIASSESPIANRANFRDLCSQILRPRTLVMSLEMALTFAAFFWMLIQPENLTNTFRFTSQDSKLLLTYYVMGSSFGCILTPSLLDTFGSISRVAWFSVLSLLLGCGLMLMDIASDDVNVVLTCFCMLLIGASITASLLTNLKHCGELMTFRTVSEQNAFMACVIGLSGLTAAIMCFLSDFLYYLNRNALIWAYMESSAFPIGMCLLSAILVQFTSAWFPATSASIRLNASRSTGNSSPAALKLSQ